MRLEIALEKKDKFWLSSIPSLDLITQGRTKKESLEMIIDALKLLINEKSFKALIVSDREEGLFLQTNNNDAILALLIKRQRQKHGLTLKEVAKNLVLCLS